MSTLIPLNLVDGDTLFIDNSSLESFQTCPRQAQYSVSARRRAAVDRVPLRFGGITHKVLEPRYRSSEPMYAQTAPVQKEMISVAEREFLGVKQPDGSRVGGWSPPSDDYRTFDMMLQVIQGYGTYYPYESFDVLRLPDGRPFVEFPFALPLGEIHVNADFLVQTLGFDSEGKIVKVGEPVVKFIAVLRIMWTGRIDLVYSMSGGTYLMDHKTSSMATNMQEFELSHQFYGYKWAVEQILKTPVTGCVINRIVVRKPTKTGQGTTFERKLIAFQDGLAADWRTDILHIIADYAEMVRRGHMPKHTGWCVGKFGACQFHKVCSLDTLEQRDLVLSSGEYEDNIWSPLTETT